MTAPRVIVVVKRSAYRRHVEIDGDSRARRLVRAQDPAVINWQAAHQAHLESVDQVIATLESFGARALVLAGAHASFDVERAALVVAVGGDGTLLAASHNIGTTPLLGVNSAPRFSVGFFCPARRSNLKRMLGDALEGKLRRVRLARMAVIVNGSIRSRRVLNEALFCHASPAATSRYILVHGKRREDQKSSGFWVGPAAGSTAALRSAGGKVLPLGSKKIQLVVREPYNNPGRRYRLTRIFASPKQKIAATSKMMEGCMFLDGPYRRIALELGDVASFQISDEPLSVLGLETRRNDGSRAG